ncbi:MAG: glycosyltransferase family 2 protein [Acidobacteria bacterium]|nr:glycosyltransferase family 2 protein [Acidobacteriota bacterium]
MVTDPSATKTDDGAALDDIDVIADAPPTATIVLPAYNEAEALPTVIEEIVAVLGSSYEIIVVDDGSTDDTARVAAEAGAIVIRHEVNEGKGAAMATAARHAKSDALIFMDADATYPPDAIPKMVASLESHQLCRGDRSHGSANIPTINRLGNRVFSKLVSGFHGVGGDVLSGLYAIRNEDFEDLKLQSVGFDVEVEIGIKSRLLRWDTDSIEIEYRPRIGDKKLSPGIDGLRILIRVLGMLVLYRPVATFVIPGLFVMSGGIVGAVLLRDGPVQIASLSLGLSIHSFVVATFGIIAGLQAVILGVAASVYRQEAGFDQSKFLVRLTHRRSRLTIAMVGGLLAIGGFIWMSILIIGWLTSGADEFSHTQNLVFSSATSVIGLQLMSAGIFLSIFAERSPRHAVLL